VCGICGFLEPRPGVPQDSLERTALGMARALRHRGPDAQRAWADAERGVALGHARLGILDLSEAGAQPMVSASGRYVLAYNGELYDFRELRAELRGLGHAFRGESDTEVLLVAIEAWGVEAALERALGMWAFALWDRVGGELVLARDRIGKKPLYYGWVDGRLLFGSELSALHAHPGFRAEIDPDALGFLVQYSYVPAPHSIYRGIAKLPAGSLLRLRPGAGPGSARPGRFWRLEDVVEAGAREPFRGSVEEAVDALEALLGDAVERRMIADVPLGGLLSGGVDSAAVVSLMQARAGSPVRTFTIGFEEQSHDESEGARRVAVHLGTEHHTLVARPGDALALIPDLPALYDEPFADTSQIPTALVARLARSQVTVALSGDGGDEVLAGYDRYFRALARWRALGAVPAAWRRAAARWLQRLAPVRSERAVMALGAAGLRELFVRMNARCPDPTRFVPEAQPLASAFSAPEAGPRVPPLSWMMWLDTAQRLPESILTKVDRASMGVGLEVRCPLLDTRVIELLARMPEDWKVREGRRKWLLRRVLARHLPTDLVGPEKRGFGVPLGDWLRGPLRDWAEALLDPSALERDGLLDASAVRAVWDQHLTGRRDRRFLLWNLLMFQAWRQGPLFQAQPPPTARADGG
jgi:asparagine synthase (glutamine-hydrolysing)